MTKAQSDNEGRARITPVVSHITDNGLIVELLYRPRERRTLLAIGRGSEWRTQARLLLPAGETLVPYAAANNLIRNACVLLPSEPAPYADTATLIGEIRAYLGRYLSLSETFERIAPWYVLLSWVHDAFNELAYLRFRGDYGTGKTRALLTLGAICYRPFYASGASTPSPIFHTLNAFGGTLILDEADFRFSDEKADIVKILNNGNVRGLPVLRTIVTKEKEFNPQAFRVFGPKIIAMRTEYDDPALESRFLTEESDHVTASDDVPINLPAAQTEEALALRNQLLVYRFRNLGEARIKPAIDWPADPRLRQTALPLLSLIDDDDERTRVRAAVVAAYAARQPARGQRLEEAMIEALVAGFGATADKVVAVRDIAERFNALHGHESGWVASTKWVGSFLRHRFKLSTHKSNGVFVVSRVEWPKISALAARFAQRAGAQPSR